MNTTDESDVSQLLRRAMPDDCPEAVSQCMKDRLAAFRGQVDAKPERSGNRISRWLGALTARQRVAALGGIGAVTLLAFFVLCQGLATSPLSAMEKMAESIRKAKSYKYNCSVRIAWDHPRPGRPQTTESQNVIYWLAPGSARCEYSRSDEERTGGGFRYVEVTPFREPSICIDRREKTFARQPALRKGAYSSVFDDIERLAAFSGKADRDLGVKEINGKKAHGFRIDNKKVHADSDPGFTEIWLDAESNLPLFIHYEFKHFNHTSIVENSDIQWNIDLNPQLFDPTPPKGYADESPKPPTLEQQLARIVEALKIYSDVSGGQYPQTEHFSTLDDDLCRRLGLTEITYAAKEGDAGKAARAARGFNQLLLLCVYNADFAYYGKTVKPGDKHKVLLRWKLDDGRYEVIFGDLSAKTATAEQLRTLEPPQR
jgi:outer membrane lipoprotein-sorting protein